MLVGKKIGMLLVKLGVGAGLILWLVEKVNWSVVLEKLADISPVFIVLYIVFQLAGNVISARKWQTIASHKHQELMFTVKEGFFTYLTGAFINNFLPSTIGGDAYRGLWLAQKTEAKAASLSTVVFDRFIGLWTTALLALFCSIPLWKHFFTDTAFRLTMLALVLFLLVDLFVTYAYFQPWFHRMLAWLPFKLQRLIQEVIGFTKKGIWTIGSLYSVLFALVGIALSNWMLFHALGSPVNFLSFLSVIFLVTIISAVPLSINNIGIKEWAYVTFFALIGVSAEVAVTAALLSRFLQMLISFIALPHYIAGRRQAVDDDQRSTQ
ncbi:MAG: flippase-like domain-containing protein [Candidatus Moranbacteria bacterium]|nr:flippase-like domain-containing protein [Candidatus Moranbacteria bacterium]